MTTALRGVCLGLAFWAMAAGMALAGASVASSTEAAPQRVLVMLRLPPEHLRPNSDYGGGYGDAMGRSALRRVASRLARANRLRLVDDWPMPLVGVDCFVLAVPDGQSPTEVAARLSSAPEVVWSQPMNLYRGQSAAPPQGRLYLAQPTAKEWRLAELHKVATGRNVRVAVIDSQVERTHPDLAGQVETSQNFAPGRAGPSEQHGTAVAGLIAAKGIGIDGVAPGVRLMALRACWQQKSGPAPATVCDSLSLAKALDFAINHTAQVINLSLGGPPDPLLGKLLDVAAARRIVVVAAYDRNLPGGGFPASHPGVVPVADEAWGAPPAGVYSAPGRDVPTTTPGGHWALVNGSSFAAAQVSGLFALLREHRPSSSAPLRLVSAPGGGAIDACATLLGAAQSCEGGRNRLREVSAVERR
jgi:hypothetical protein